MQVYYNHYGRRDGFRFFGTRWPQGIGPDLTDLQGAGWLWMLFTRLYGDHCVDQSEPVSRFILRDCFGALHATVSGEARVSIDGRRSVTEVDFVIRIPQDPQELLDDPAPQALWQEVASAARQAAPGTLVQAGHTLPQLPRQVAPGAAARLLGRELAWRSGTLLAAGPTVGHTLTTLAPELYAALPAARRRRFSFITHCTRWQEVFELGGIDLVGTPMTQDTVTAAAHLDQNGRPLLFWQEGASAVHLPKLPQDPALAYLHRLYPSLLERNALDLPDRSLALLRELDFFRPCEKLPATSAQALSLMIRASRGPCRALFAPSAAEKQSLAARLFP